MKIILPIFLAVVIALVVVVAGLAYRQFTTASQPAPRAPGSESSAAASGIQPPGAESEGRFDPATIQLRLDPVVGGLAAPTFVTNADDGTGRLFVVERAGRVRVIANGRLLPAPLLDLTPLVGSRGEEQGLLSLAFHPDFSRNGFFFVCYTDPSGSVVVARYSVPSGANVADGRSGKVILRVPHAQAQNNYGGQIAFGPDRYLYVGLGDGGGSGDQFRNAQNLGSFLGKILRIDVDDDDPYGVPTDNPFTEVSGARPEVWAYGLRDPRRFSFDRLSGDLFIADVGQTYGEINHQGSRSNGGENYGWAIMDGTHCYPSGDRCNRNPLEEPIHEYDHGQGCAVTGGFVYGGTAARDVQDLYVYADACTGRIWALEDLRDGRWLRAQLLDSRLRVSSFGEDEDGELYLTSSASGVVYRLMFAEVG